MSKTSGAQILPFYAQAQVLFPLYRGIDPVIEDDHNGPSDGEGRLEPSDGKPHFQIRTGYPPLIIGPALFQEWLRDICGHELGHPYENLAINYFMKKNNWTFLQASLYVHKLYWDFRKFSSSWEQREIEATQRDADGSNSGWQFHPRESWAEAFKAALLGYWPITPGHTVGADKAYDEGKKIDAMALRGFFQSLTQEVTPLIPFQDLTVAENNYYRGRDGRTVDTLLLHTMVGTWQSANSRFNNPTAQVSAHRGICWDGIQRRWVEDEFTAYHAGDWEINLRSIGIEGEDMGDYNGTRPDLFYSLYGSVVAEYCQKYPAIKPDRYHVVPGICCHRDVHATACPDALDTDRILWIARKIIGGGDLATFDPRNNPDDLKFLDDRYAANTTADAMKATYNPVAKWWSDHGFGTLPHLSKLMGGPEEERQPDIHMKGTPPEGHPAHETKAGTHTPGKGDTT